MPLSIKILSNTIKYLSCNIRPMRKFIVLALCLSGAQLTACYTPPKANVTQALAGNYALDPAHTSIIWTIKHAGLSNYTARFDTVSGILNFSPENPQNSHVDISINSTSINTGDSEFDKTIGRGSQYFNADKYPQIKFTSTSITMTGKNTGEIIGNLSFRGKTQQITLATIFNGAGKSFGHSGKTLGFSATTQFNRSDFGLNHLMAFGIGDQINITIEAEFNEKQT